MKNYIKKILRENLFDDDFNNTLNNHGEVVDEKIVKENLTLTLYRGLRTQRQLGMSTEPNTTPELIDIGDKYLLKVDKYPDKLIWFTDNEDFAKKYSGWGLITYKLPVIKHKKIITHEDGYKTNEFNYGNESVESGFGRGIINVDMYNNSHLYRGIELPENWYWSYKVEKHIVCDTDLKIPKDWVVKFK